MNNHVKSAALSTFDWPIFFISWLLNSLRALSSLSPPSPLPSPPLPHLFRDMSRTKLPPLHLDTFYHSLSNPNLTPLTPLTDVTPKAITHRIAKLRSMADDASTPVASTNGNPGPAKRNSPAKRTPATTTSTTAPATKKPVATPAYKDPVLVTGTKRNAAGTAKQATTANGKAAKDANDNAVDDDEVDVKPSANKKIKISNADVKNGIKVFEDGSAATAAATVDGEGGVEYAA